MFSQFAKWMSKKLGNSYAFMLAFISIVVWFLTGPIFGFSDTWQLVINTGTTIVTFLMVFLLQNTQNRDTVAIHLKLDELIRAMKNTHNELIKIEELSDEDLGVLLEKYENLSTVIGKRLAKGKNDQGVLEVPKDSGKKKLSKD